MNGRRSTQDLAVLGALVLVAVFVVGSLVVQTVLIVTDDLEADEGLWRPLFDLVAILVGAVAGFMGGRATARGDDT